MGRSILTASGTVSPCRDMPMSVRHRNIAWREAPTNTFVPGLCGWGRGGARAGWVRLAAGVRA
jgi:hypothetical protein